MIEPREPVATSRLTAYLKKLFRWNKSNIVIGIEGMRKQRDPSGTLFNIDEGGVLGGKGKSARPRWQ